ncbi:PREDICTED: cytochrome P450 2J3-like isoform X1 [Priapulus caudatus]|uniref:Cytochrome P450 2J3-like isoform X1 n=1 Tax=Priapulus caudatus TaxID=37621 RepID=A0ABM1F179_PRICU|nr:PREDICTED: cytochrome P450 2J3-like isoform X1 [Priapulus caudatus]XP_014678201.1 PREDICTED: cytochrome P450 2J3-like isoform X1 [Priapulus caudatus]
MSHSWLYSGEKAFVLDVTAVLILLVIFLLTVRWLSFPKNLPPGPLGLPLVGYLPFLTNHPYLKFTELSKKYGSVFTVWFGSLPVIIVSGYDAVYEAFATREHDFMERPHLTIPRKLFGYDGLIFGAYGERWKNTRKFTMTALRDFGVGKATLEERIIAELEAVTEELDLTKGAPFNPRRIMKQAASNVICSINFGDRFEYSDKRFQHLMNLTDELFSMRIITNAVNVMPILRFIPNGILPKALAIMKDIRKFTQEVVDEHRLTFDPNAIRDFVDYYLLAQQESAQVDSAGTIIKGVHLDSLSDSHLFPNNDRLIQRWDETTANQSRLPFVSSYLLKHPGRAAKGATGD